MQKKLRRKFKISYKKRVMESPSFKKEKELKVGEGYHILLGLKSKSSASD